LQKDPGKRLQHIDGARILIEEALTGTTTASAIGLAGAPQPARWRRAMTLGLVALVGGVISVALWSLISSSPPPQQSLNRFVISPSPTAPLARSGLNDLAISFDGKRIVYIADRDGTRQLYVRSLDDFVATPIPGTERTVWSPFFSPDGESVAFVASGQLKRASVMGGSPRTLCDIVGSWQGGSWFEDTIVFGDSVDPGGGLFRVSASGGEPEHLATLDRDKGETVYGAPQILPGGKAVLFTVGHGPDPSQIAVLSLQTGEQKILVEGGSDASYTPSGHLIYALADTGSLMAVPFDLQRLEVSGDPVPVLQGASQTDPGGVIYALSPSGTLVYVPDLGASRYSYSLVWVDRTGIETLVTQEKREYATPRISPDGKRVLFSMRQTGGATGVVIYDLEQDSFSRLAVEATQAGSAIWTPDGKWITFQAVIDGPLNIYRQLTDRSGLPEPLATLPNELSKMPTSWSPDGRVLILNDRTQNPDAWDILTLNREENEELQPFIATSGHECCARFSPDGQWLAYVSDERGRNQVYIRPYPGPGVKFLVSEEGEGGGEPVWSPDGRELFYRSGKRMMVVSVQT